MSPPLILASASPRRSRLLREAGIEFLAVPAEIDETPGPNESPVRYAERTAWEKARKVAALYPGKRTLGADTIVVLPQSGETGAILGKPNTSDEAFRMLRLLSGETHLVITAVAFALDRSGREASRPVESDGFHVTSRVVFRELSDREIQDYVDTGEPMDKAGAYAIQEGAAGFVERYEGSWSNIVGLPIEEVVCWLRAHTDL